MRNKLASTVLGLWLALGLVGCSATEAETLMSSATILTNGTNHWFITLSQGDLRWWVNCQLMIEQPFVQAGTDSPWAINNTLQRLQLHNYVTTTWQSVPDAIKGVILSELVTSAPTFLPVPFLILPIVPDQIFPTPTPIILG